MEITQTTILFEINIVGPQKKEEFARENVYDMVELLMRYNDLDYTIQTNLDGLVDDEE